MGRRLVIIAFLFTAVFELDGTGDARGDEASDDPTSTTSTAPDGVSIAIIGDEATGSVECTDYARAGVIRNSRLVVTVPLARSTDLDVTIATESSALEMFEPLPTTLTITAGSTTASANIVVHRGRARSYVDLTATIATSPDYTIVNGVASALLEVERDPAIRLDCGFIDELGATNAVQTIVIGGRPETLRVRAFGMDVFDPAAAQFRVLTGSMPAGTELASDGSFRGRATALGITTATVEACLEYASGDCVSFEVGITVVDAELPTTGRPDGNWHIVGITALAVGAMFRRRRLVR